MESVLHVTNANLLGRKYVDVVVIVVFGVGRSLGCAGVYWL